MPLAKARELIRGEKGTSIKLTIKRDGVSQELEVFRGAIAIQVAKGQMLENGIGLITIANFDDRCANETKAAIEELTKQGAKALIFDVRNNPGGYKHELVELLDYLLPKGVVFKSELFNGEVTEDKSDSSCLEIPMAVLFNKDTYSAAEFFAAALEEFDWAVTVGEHSTGKGYFQTNIKLADGSAVHLSVGKYFTPNGVSLAEVGGIAPNVEVLLDEEQTKQLLAGDLTPENDPQMQAAVSQLLEKLK
jgi:carboxyl-terminal processing protease